MVWTGTYLDKWHVYALDVPKSEGWVAENAVRTATLVYQSMIILVLLLGYQLRPILLHQMLGTTSSFMTCYVMTKAMQ